MEREKVLRTVASDGTNEAVAFLARKAASSDRLARLAAKSLGEVVSPKADASLHELARSENPLVAGNAVRAIGNLRRPEDVGFLCAIAEERPGTRAWQEAIRALGRTGSVQARRYVEGFLVLAGGEQERMLVLAALKELAAGDSVGALEWFLGRGDLRPAERVFANDALLACRASLTPPKVRAGGAAASRP